MIVPYGGAPARLIPDEPGQPGPEEWCRPLDRPHPLQAMIHGVGEADPQVIWERGHFIERGEYEWRVELGDWARREAPEQPEARPREPVVAAKLPSFF